MKDKASASQPSKPRERRATGPRVTEQRTHEQVTQGRVKDRIAAHGEEGRLEKASVETHSDQ